jgi:hypothetical protein
VNRVSSVVELTVSAVGFGDLRRNVKTEAETLPFAIAAARLAPPTALELFEIARCYCGFRFPSNRTPTAQDPLPFRDLN